MDAEELLPESRLIVRRRAYFPIARAHSKALNVLRASPIDWTYLSPATYFVPGERTDRFRLGNDELIAIAEHGSRISREDYAVALVDELEKPRHRRRRFSVGYKQSIPKSSNQQ